MRMKAWLGFIVLLIAAGGATAQERALSWDALRVTAHLDEKGRLHVDETQEMLFTGDWNGGERTFRISPRQSIDFEGMGRIDPATGDEIPLEEGGLAFVDRFEWYSPKVLRWRSRETSDPPFDNTKITYVLHYALSNILVKTDDGFLLSHDFAFTDRAGEIREVRVDLTLDPAWTPEKPEPLSWTGGPLPPGRGFVIELPLRYGGTEEIAADGGISATLQAMMGSLILLPLIFLAGVLLREKSIGRFDPLPVEAVDRRWLEQNLLPLRAELVGALWDQDVGPSEVSAILARMVAEGKLKSQLGSGSADDSLELDLLVPRSSLEGYERQLVDALFIDGNHTSTQAVREHYKSTGFDPVRIISPDLTSAAAGRLPPGKASSLTSWVGCLGFLAVAGFLVYVAVKEPASRPHVVVTSIAGFVLLILSSIFPSLWSKKMHRGLGSALVSLIPAALSVGVAIWILSKEGLVGDFELSRFVLLAIFAVALFIVYAAVSGLRSLGTRETIAARKMLTASREYFRQELQKERPALEDSWYPYLLAFGLSREVEQWSVRNPSSITTPGTFSGSSSSSSSSSGSSWTGGGGAFGGAGASGAWAAAAGGMAAAVASPSSSSGGSSGGGGGSSGGGGGGGW